MTEQEISVKLTETEQRAKSNTHRIEKLEQQQKDLNKLVTAVEVLASREKGVEELFAACHRYFRKTGRRISFEYAMIDGVNDHDWQADLLAEKIRGMPGHVNLIPLNDVVESEFKPSKRVAAFQKRLESHGLTATVRRSLGGDIDASCGQLRRKEMKAREGVAQ